ncbi:MAG: helix-turn-helix transcriptional regulator [Collinsella sp.]|nr:helix-turn-helix transcriptional regulator [Collinsella sp.]
MNLVLNNFDRLGRRRPRARIEDELACSLEKIMWREGINQRQLAAIMGVSTSTLSGFLTGSRQLPMRAVVAVADKYDIPVTALLGR